MKMILIFNIINTILMFVARSIFIKVLGVEVLGLNSLLLSLIGFLNMAELGIGMAIGYSLYKPLSQKNYEKINDIMILFKKYYKDISFKVLIFGLVLSIFLPIFIKGQTNLFNAYIYYFIYLINCVLSYLFTYKQTLIISDQKQYKIIWILNCAKIVKVIFQCIQLFIISSFIIWLFIEVIFNILGLYLTNLKIDREYKEKINYYSEKTIKFIEKENSNIKTDIKNIFFHKVAGFVVFQTDTILISLFSTLKETAVYSNYMMIINNISVLLNSVLGSIKPTIGNLIAEESKENSYLVFRKLYLLDHLIAIFITIVTFTVINKFIIFWVGDNFLFSNTVVFVLIINLYIQISRGTVERFKDSFGIFWDVKAPVIESIMNLIFSIIMAYKFGIIGVFVGTIISNIFIVKIWKPYILFKEGFEINIKKYILQTINIYIRNILIIILSNIVYKKFELNINNLFIDLVLNFVLISFIVLILIILIYSNNKDFKQIFKILLNKFKKYSK
ncbi:hypothetical protein JJB49_12165 [Clostridium perfringens]|nr:hypothetical protein [Clostridium perfringens]MDM0963114.1 hypothetical protein [Clostridium perfringens]